MNVEASNYERGLLPKNRHESQKLTSMNEETTTVCLRQGRLSMMATLTNAELEMCKKVRAEDPAKWERNEARMLLEAQRRLSESRNTSSM